jgi:AcrR family transcriptional regulator
MLAGLAEAAAERGVSDLRVSDVLMQSGVSRTTFYQHFDDLHECVVAAYLAAFEELMRGISEACASAPDWPRGVLAAIDFSLDFSLESPARAQLISGATTACDPRLERHSRLVLDQLAGLLRFGRQRLDPAPILPELTEWALIGGAISVVGTRLATGQLLHLSELKPELAQLLLTPYLGRQAAAGMVEASVAPG